MRLTLGLLLLGSLLLLVWTLAPIVWIAVNPTPRRWHVWNQISRLNREFARVCGQHRDVHAVDLSPPPLPDGRPDPALFRKDRLHLNAAGYEYFAADVRRTLERIVPSSAAEAA